MGSGRGQAPKALWGGYRSGAGERRGDGHRDGGNQEEGSRVRELRGEFKVLITIVKKQARRLRIRDLLRKGSVLEVTGMEPVKII